MLRLLVDENFNGDVMRGLLRQQPDVDLLRVQDIDGLGGADDGRVLAWAAEHARIVITHDRATMPFHAGQRMASGLPMPGVFIINDRLPVRDAIAELILLIACSDLEDWQGRVVYLPL